MTTDARSLATPRFHHAVRFYENDRSLARLVADFLADGFAAGNPAIIVATPAHRAAILRELVTKSLDIVELQRADDLILLDAQDTLSTFLVDGKPAADRFEQAMCAVIARACDGRPDCTVRVYGEMVDLLWKDCQQESAIQLEMMWNQLANSKTFSLLCGYAMGHFYKDANFERICGEHTHVISDDESAVA
jgi:MEDS: MEthanogen/methylotroph, DcmR Sensory domain